VNKLQVDQQDEKGAYKNEIQEAKPNEPFDTVLKDEVIFIARSIFIRILVH
jgi:hypothetical protein